MSVRGQISRHNKQRLKALTFRVCSDPKAVFKPMIQVLSKSALLSSFSIFSARAEPSWNNPPYLVTNWFAFPLSLLCVCSTMLILVNLGRDLCRVYNALFALFAQQPVEPLLTSWMYIFMNITFFNQSKIAIVILALNGQLWVDINDKTSYVLLGPSGISWRAIPAYILMKMHPQYFFRLFLLMCHCLMVFSLSRSKTWISFKHL